MFDTISESIRLAVFLGICVYLWFLTGKKGVRGEWGWPYIFAALFLINIGLAISLTEDFPSLSRFLVLGHSPYEPFIKNLVVFFAGFVLLIVGIAKMITPVVALKETREALEESHEQLEKRVQERTAALKLVNEHLRCEIFEREAAEAALQKVRNELEDTVDARTAELKKTNKELLAEISRRTTVEKELRESEERYRTLVELLPVGVGIHCQGKIVFLNRAAAAIMGAGNAEEIMGKPLIDLVALENRELSMQRIVQMLKDWMPAPVDQIRFVQVDGTLKDAEVHATPISHNGEPAVLVAALDISDRKRAEEQIRASLKEKEVMLREIHHRVKNNLAMIISLLSLQSRYTSDETVHRMFSSTQDRIRSMVLAHEVLYRSENLADVQIGEYVGTLADHLLVAMGNVGVSIDLKKEVENVSFSLDTAVPLAQLRQILQSVL